MRLPELIQRLRQLHLVVLSALVLAAGANAADAATPAPAGDKPATITIQNLSGKPRKLRRIVVHEKNKPEPVEIIEVDATIPAEGSKKIECATFTSKQEVVVSSTTWVLGSGLVWEVLSTVNFANDTGGKAVRYTLMYSTQTEISYDLTAADLAQCIAVPEDQNIVVSNGQDLTGHFPPSVVFMDQSTYMPFDGVLTSAGDMKHLQVWTYGHVDVPVAGDTLPQLDGVGDLTSNGTISLLLSDAQPGAMAVLLAGLTEINVPFAGTTLGPAPRLVIPGLLVDENGENELSFTLGEMPVDLDIYLQEFVLGPGGASPVATNTLVGHSF